MEQHCNAALHHCRNNAFARTRAMASATCIIPSMRYCRNAIMRHQYINALTHSLPMAWPHCLNDEMQCYGKAALWKHDIGVLTQCRSYALPQ